jgi:DUF1680 family protein
MIRVFLIPGIIFIFTIYSCNERRIKDQFVPLPPNSIRFHGYLENDIGRSLENWNKGVVPYDSLVEVFRSGRAFFAQGEMWGKAVRSGCMFYRYTQDPELKEILDATVADLLSTIRKNGSISCSPISAQPDGPGGDPWERKYVLLGLHGYYTLVEQNPEVLQAMLDQADCIVAQIGPLPKTRIVDLGWSPNHIESSTLLEPMMRLYNMTANQAYLNFARYIVEEEGGALGHNIIEDAFNNEDPVNIGGVYPKAYEMMSLFEGLVEYYRVTADDRWKEAIMNLYHKIIEKEITIIGNAGGDLPNHPRVMGEAWNNTAMEQTNPDMNRMMETCVGVTWMKFCSQILRLTGDPSTVDMIEKYAYNGLIGAMKPGGDGFSYVNRLNGSKTITTGWGGMIDGVHVTCCNLNGPMGLAYLPFLAIMDSEEGPVINLYNACTATANTPRGKPVQIDIETDYPLNGVIAINLTPDKPEKFTLRLRIPEWSLATSLKVNGDTFTAEPGAYSAIFRHWSPGDRIELKLDMRCRLLEAPHGSNRKGDHYQALVRGPIVLSRDENIDEYYNEAVSITPVNGYVEIISETPAIPGTRMQFQVPTSKGYINMVDYASVNSWEGKHICTWLPVEDISGTGSK